MYSQNSEEKVVLDYFKEVKGNFLDIGANDGITFSNVRKLAELWWSGILLEPSPKAFEKLKANYVQFVNCTPLNIGIALESEEKDFWESGSFQRKGDDVSLVSSIKESEKLRWGNSVDWEMMKADFLTFDDFLKYLEKKGLPTTFDFISIDAEGLDYDILKQINLNKVGCKCLCIEWNSKPHLYNEFVSYCNRFGMKLLHKNPENLIFVL